MGNYFNDINLDIKKFKERVLENKKHKLEISFFPKIDLFCNILVRVFKVSREFIYSFIFRKWFNNFSKFWYEILNGRPIDIFDFHYLRLAYRCKFQIEKNYDEDDNNDYLKVWNNNENIYLIFKADGGGLDSKKSVLERTKALEFINGNFEIKKGEINPLESLNFCVARKM